MELFAKLGINGKLLFAQAFNFLAVLWILKRYVFPRIVKMLEDRRATIEKGLAMHEEAQREVARADSARREILAKADTEAEKIAAEAKMRAEARLQEAESHAKAIAENILLKAKAQSETIQRDAVVSAKADIRAAALMVAEKILSRSVTADDDERAVEEVVEALSQSN